MRSWMCLFALIFASCSLHAGDTPDQKQMKLVLKQVASDIEKNFYDPKMKGVDWKAAVKEAEKKIDKAVMINEMFGAIYELSEQVDDS